VQGELVTIQQTIHRRVSAILGKRGDWLCRKGCDECCRHLAAIPEITRSEWELLRSGLQALPSETRQAIQSRVEDLRQSSRPFLCPFLDLSDGACSVYESRPVACRTYGFYVDRDTGLYCGSIQDRVEKGEYQDVIWGNDQSIQSSLSALGATRSLLDWMEEDQ